MAITTDDFNKIWASTSPLTPYSFSASQYKEGWNFIGSTPPSRQMWDYLQKNNDEKMQYLLNHFDNYLPLSGGTLTGIVNGVTPTAGDNSTKIATTEFVNATAGNYLPLSGGTLTGVVDGVTPTAGDNSTKIATTEFVNATAGNYLPLSGGTLTGVVDGVTPTAGDNSTKIATTEFVNATAGNYLPLSGGTMTTGETLITMGNGESYVRNLNNGLYLGGTDKNNASTLVLFTSSNAEGFQLQAGNGTTFKRMVGKPDGTLTWDNKGIERVSAKGTYGMRFESGMQICWGELAIPAGTSGREVSDTMTFQYPFANANYSLSFGNDWCASSSEYYRAEGRNTANFKFTAVGVGQNKHRAFYFAIGYWK